MFSKAVPRVETFENAASHMLFKGCYDISIVLAFSCEYAKTIQIRYMWTHTFWKMEKKITVSTNIGGYE